MDEEDWRAMREVIAGQFKLPAYRQAFLYRRNIWNSGFAVAVNQILGEIDEPAA